MEEDVLTRIEESELILNPDGSIYHLNLFPDEIANTVIMVGDPGRVKTISAFFDRIDVERKNREIITHTGELDGMRLSVISTGMGCGNMDIVMNELDALANIDLQKRVRKRNKRKLRLIRLGTSGALNANIHVDSFVASKLVIGMDGIMQFYQCDEGLFRKDLADEFERFSSWPSELPKPYAVASSENLLNLLAKDMNQGITLTALGFYAPQGRVLNGNPAFPDLDSKIQQFTYEGDVVTNFEMESSSLYGFSKIFGHEALTICAIVANRAKKTISKDYKNAMARLVEHTLNKLTG